MASEKIFPNGFKSWSETHFEIVSMIAVSLQRDEHNGTPSVAYRTREQHGLTEVWKLAEDWTDEFEKMNAGRNWSYDFLEEVEKFTFAKLSGE
jgi:hypothetical protein